MEFSALCLRGAGADDWSGHAGAAIVAASWRAAHGLDWRDIDDDWIFPDRSHGAGLPARQSVVVYSADCGDWVFGCDTFTAVDAVTGGIERRTGFSAGNWPEPVFAGSHPWAVVRHQAVVSVRIFALFPWGDFDIDRRCADSPDAGQAGCGHAVASGFFPIGRAGRRVYSLGRFS